MPGAPAMLPCWSCDWWVGADLQVGAVQGSLVEHGGGCLEANSDNAVYEKDAEGNAKGAVWYEGRWALGGFGSWGLSFGFLLCETFVNGICLQKSPPHK